MKKYRRFISTFLTVMMVIGMLAACGGTGTSTPPNSLSETSAASSGERPKMTIFLGDSGVPAPSGVDVSDSKFIRLIEDYAGVDLEVIQPSYADYQTQFNLLLASGDLPDIVHTYYPDDAISYADQGAFIDLKDYYDNSPVVQNVVSEEVMEMSKSASGHYYRIPASMGTAKKGYGNWIRYDLLQEYNGGKFPTDVQGYVDFLYWVKETYPDSIPLSARNNDTKIFLYGEAFFKWFGAMPQSYNVVDGQVVSTFTLPEYRAAVELYRQLYADGILDKEFATNNADTYISKMSADNVAISTDLPLSLQSTNANAAANGEERLYVFTPELETYPDVVSDEIYTKAFNMPPCGIHGLYISSSCKNPDLAWKVIEAFASEELRELVTWGEEGVQHTVENGKKIPNAEAIAADDHKFGLHFTTVIWGPGGNLEAQDAIAEERMGEERYKLHKESEERVAAEAQERGYALIDVFRYTGGLLIKPDRIKEKEAEIDRYTAEATVNAITGQISMEEFDQRVENYKTQYAFVDEEWTKALQENKDFLISVGCKEAGR